MNGWRTVDVLAEGWRNLGVRTVVLTGVAGLIVASLALAELSTTSGLLAFNQARQRAGGSVWTIEGAEGLRARDCEALNRVDGVVAAGGVTRDAFVTFGHAPAAEFVVSRTTPNILAVWDPDFGGAREPGIVLGDAAAYELGVVEGSHLGLEGVSVPVAAILEVSDRNPSVARHLIVPDPTLETADVCWVAFGPSTNHAAYDLLASWFPRREERVIRPVLGTNEFNRDPVAEFRQRPQRVAWAAAGAVLTLAAAMMWWLRRSEPAIYRALGLPTSGLALLAAVETLAIATGGLMSGVGWAAAIHSVTQGPPTTGQLVLALRTAALAMLTFAAVTPVAMTVAIRGDLANALKDR